MGRWHSYKISGSYSWQLVCVSFALLPNSAASQQTIHDKFHQKNFNNCCYIEDMLTYICFYCLNVNVKNVPYSLDTASDSVIQIFYIINIENIKTIKQHLKLRSKLKTTTFSRGPSPTHWKTVWVLQSLSHLASHFSSFYNSFNCFVFEFSHHLTRCLLVFCQWVCFASVFS